MFNFSFVLIARNEAETLPRFLDSVKYFRDNGGEVIIVDTGSTDKTASIALERGCKVYEEGDRFKIKIDANKAQEVNDHFGVALLKDGDSVFDFASARNYAASLASNSMISMPDCDEVWTKFDYEKVQKMIDDGVERLEYNFVFSHDQFGNEVIKFLHSKFYNRDKQKWVGVVHEVLSGEANHQYVDESVLKLEHFQNEKTNRSGYLKGLAIDCFENPTNDRNSHYFGRELLWYGHYEAAIKELKRHLTISWWSPERSQSMIYIGEAYGKLGNTEEELAWYFKAYTECAERREPLWAISEYYFKKDDFKRVAALCEAMLTIPQSNFYANFSDLYQHLPHQRLALAYWYLGDREKARKNYDIALKYLPLDEKLLHDYRFHYDLPKISILVPTLGRPEGLQKLKDSIEKLNYPKELLEVLIEEDEPRIGVPKRLNKLFKQSTGEYAVFAANDTEFDPNALIIAYIEMHSKPVAQQWLPDDLLAFNTGELYEDKGNICEHFMIKRSFVNEKLKGEIFCEEMSHVGVDNLLWAQVNKWGNATRSMNAKMIHNHFTRTQNPLDEVYKMAYANAEKDRETLKIKLEELNSK